MTQFRKRRIEEMGRLSTEAFIAAEKIPVRVILDDIRSMHNVGALFRTSDAFRIEALHLCGITPKPPHREIHKTAIGAEKSVRWEYHEDILSLIQLLLTEDYTLIGVEQTEDSIPLQQFQVDPSHKYALILGHEIQGVKQEVLALCEAVVEIPQFGTKHSLNISVSAGISLFHFSHPFFGGIMDWRSE